MLQRKLGRAGCSPSLGGAAAPNLTGLPLLNLRFHLHHRILPTGELTTQWRKTQTLKYNKRVLPILQW